MLVVVCSLLLVGLAWIVWCFLRLAFVVCCLLFDVCYLWFVVCWVLGVVCCLLVVV